MAKKLALIHPAQRNDLFVSDLLYSPLAFAYIGAYTPSDWDISLYDEYVDDFVNPEEIDADLVAMSALTPNIPRAYYIANKLRDKGTKVVIGGAHVTALAEEALDHVHTVVKGEAEDIWPTLISDFEQGKLKPVYDGRMNGDISKIKLPRRDLIHPNYKFPSVITSKGCPFKCNFCYLSIYEKNSYRVLPVEAIIEDLDRLNKTVDFAVIFVDENVSGYSNSDHENRMELFEKMAKRKYKFVWGAQSTVDVYKKPELLTLMHKAGCRTLFLGLESINNQSLGEVANKGFANRIDYNQAIKVIHKHKIGVIGSFIIGLDNQDRHYAKSLVRAMKQMNIEYPRLFYLTAWPGTALYEKLKKEKRLLKGWNKVRKNSPSIVYTHFTAKEIKEARKYVFANFFKLPYLIKIVLRWMFREPAMLKFFLKMVLWNTGAGKLKQRKKQKIKEKKIVELLEEQFGDTRFSYLLSDY